MKKLLKKLTLSNMGWEVTIMKDHSCDCHKIVVHQARENKFLIFETKKTLDEITEMLRLVEQSYKESL